MPTTERRSQDLNLILPKAHALCDPRDCCSVVMASLDLRYQNGM